MVKIREWKEKADAWDKYQYSKLSVYLPSAKELIQSEEERRWNAIFRTFFNQLNLFIIKWSIKLKWKKRKSLSY